MEQRTQEWFEARKHRVTGSNVGAILDVNPWRNPCDVMRQMVREYHGVEREFQGNAATDWGTFNEDGAAFEYELETGNKIEKCGFYTHEDWLGASPDGLIGDDGLIEIKCPYGQREKNPPQFKSIWDQPHYYAQIQVQLFCTQRQWCDFFQWSQYGTKTERVEINPKWLNENMPKLLEFYERYMVEREENADEYLQDKRIELTSIKAYALADEYEELQEAIEQADKRKKEILAELSRMSKDRDADIGGRKLTLVKKDGSISYAKAVKELLPDADLEKYRGKGSKYWRLS